MPQICVNEQQLFNTDYSTNNSTNANNNNITNNINNTTNKSNNNLVPFKDKLLKIRVNVNTFVLRYSELYIH